MVKVLTAIFSLLALLGCSDTETHSPQQERYGIVRIPVINDCEVDEKIFSLENASNVELVTFDLEISGINSNQYIHIEHKGYPSNVLNEAYSLIKKCVPSYRSNIDNISMLNAILPDYVNQSFESDVYIRISKGVFYLHSYQLLGEE